MEARRSPWSVFGRGGRLVAIATLVFGLATLRPDFAMLASGKAGNDYALIGRDFVNIWFGGKLAREAGAETVYDRDAYRSALKKEAGIAGIYAYSYPPHMLLASIPFGMLPYFAALLAWTFGGFALFYCAAKPWLKDAGLPVWTSAILPASIVNIWAGHFGFLVGALLLFGIRQAGRNSALSAATNFAILTLKPHFGILVPPLLLAFGRWRIIALTILVLVPLVILPGLIFGWSAWEVWLTSTLPFQSSLIDHQNASMAYLSMMPTAERFTAMLGLSKLPGLIVQILFATMAIFTLYRAWARKVDLPTLGLLSLIAVFLILPYAFNYDMVAYSLAIIVLAARHAKQLSDVDRTLLAGAFLVPIIHMPLARMGIQLSSPLILAALIILAGKAARA